MRMENGSLLKKNMMENKTNGIAFADGFLYANKVI